MISDWFHSRTRLVAMIDEEREGRSRALRRVEVLRSRVRRLEADVKALRLLVACTDPAVHTRLAHRVHVAETLLAQHQGKDAHRASLAPVTLEGFVPRGGDAA